MTLERPHHRKHIRLQGFDYSSPGGYFITICSHEKECVFGDVNQEKVALSPIGQIAYKFWSEIPRHFENVEMDVFVVMPNHLHGIIVINDQRRGVKFNAPTGDENFYSRISPKRGTIPLILRTYKSGSIEMVQGKWL